MPKIKPTDNDTMNRAYSGTIKNKMTRMGMSVQTFGTIIGCKERMAYTSVKTPESLSIAKVRTLVRALRLTDDEILEFIRPT